MPISPKQMEQRLQRVLTAWKKLAPAKSFAGLTVAQFENEVAPAHESRTRLAELDAQYAAEVGKRSTADATVNELIQKVVDGVKGDPEFGADSPLYGAMGYVRKSERKSGLKRGKSDTASATTTGKLAA